MLLSRLVPNRYESYFLQGDSRTVKLFNKNINTPKTQMKENIFLGNETTFTDLNGLFFLITQTNVLNPLKVRWPFLSLFLVWISYLVV